MFRTIFRPALLSLPLLPLLAAAAPVPPSAPRSTLTVEVANVRAARGTVKVDVCPEAEFLKDGCSWSGSAPARLGVTRVTVPNLPAGRYAVQVFLDENNNGEIDRGLFGIPKEGVGFSNDARITLGPPKFADAVFTVAAGGNQMIRLSLRYFTGAKGPPAVR